MSPIIRTACAACCIVIALFGTSFAEPGEDGAAAYGRGDYATALRLWRPLADQGDTQVQFMVAFMYEHGQGVAADLAEAARWYRLAAEKGEMHAQFNLGVLYFFGNGVPQDYAQTAKWYRLAADKGYALAQENLAVLYANGQGVPMDYVQAYKWYNLAVSAFTAAEKARRDSAVQSRDELAAMMTPSQIAEAQKMASEWKPAQ